MKTLSDGTQVPSRVYYYVLEYCSDKGYSNVACLNTNEAVRIADLSSKKFWELFASASEEDRSLYQIK